MVDKESEAHRSTPCHAVTHGTSRTEMKGSPRLAVVSWGLRARRIPSSLEVSPSGSRALLRAVSGGRGLPAARIP